MDHEVNTADRKRFLLLGLHRELSVTAAVICETGKTVQYSICLLVIEEAESIAVEGSSDVNSEQEFMVRMYDIYRKHNFWNNKGNLKVNCFKNTNSARNGVKIWSEKTMVDIESRWSILSQVFHKARNNSAASGL